MDIFLNYNQDVLLVEDRWSFGTAHSGRKSKKDGQKSKEVCIITKIVVLRFSGSLKPNLTFCNFDSNFE